MIRDKEITDKEQCESCKSFFDKKVAVFRCKCGRSWWLKGEEYIEIAKEKNETLICSIDGVPLVEYDFGMYLIDDKQEKDNMTTFDKIRQWGEDKGLTGENGRATTAGQMWKLQEEFDELRDAIIRNNHAELEDAIGDIVVVLTLLARLWGYKIEDCIDSAYDVIKSRQGKMVDGVFVKEAQ